MLYRLYYISLHSIYLVSYFLLSFTANKVVHAVMYVGQGCSAGRAISIANRRLQNSTSVILSDHADQTSGAAEQWSPVYRLGITLL